MTKIVLVDDHPMMRRGIRQLLELEKGMDVIAEVGSGEEASDLIAGLAPDMILLDLNMKGMSGIETLKKLREQGVSATILIVTVSDDHSDVVAAIQSGADGYILKDAEPEELIKAVKAAANGQMVVSPELTQALASALRNERATAQDVFNSLTDREAQILKLIAKGYANKAVANNLYITEATVKVHVKHLLKKLQLRSRLEAAVWAVENGHIEPRNRSF
jgi:DNA-binding NarL/FixJ family response regulator